MLLVEVTSNGEEVGLNSQGKLVNIFCSLTSYFPEWNVIFQVWVIFCVHNDTIPFLEVYADEKMALTHKPCHSYQLSNVLHITPSICPHDDDEYEFVVTFPTEMVRLTASSQYDDFGLILILAR